MERILSPERISIKIGTLVVETLYFFHDIYATAGSSRKNEKFDIKREPLFYSHIHLASFPFRPSCCLRALS